MTGCYMERMLKDINIVQFVWSKIKALFTGDSTKQISKVRDAGDQASLLR